MLEQPHVTAFSICARTEAEQQPVSAAEEKQPVWLAEASQGCQGSFVVVATCSFIWFESLFDIRWGQPLDILSLDGFKPSTLCDVANLWIRMAEEERDKSI